MKAGRYANVAWGRITAKDEGVDACIVETLLRGEDIVFGTAFAIAMANTHAVRSESSESVVLVVGEHLLRLRHIGDGVFRAACLSPHPGVGAHPWHVHVVHGEQLASGWQVDVCGLCGSEWDAKHVLASEDAR
jgi:hypothetical protein